MDPEVGGDPLGVTAPLIPEEDGAGEGYDPMPEPAGEHWARPYARHAYSTLSHFCTSALFGIITAFALKTIGRIVAMALLLLFIGFVVLQYYGFVNVSINSLGATALRAMTATPADEGDRPLTVKKMGIACSRAIAWTLSWGLLSVGGFVLGFLLGWRIL